MRTPAGVATAAKKTKGERPAADISQPISAYFGGWWGRGDERGQPETQARRLSAAARGPDAMKPGFQRVLTHWNQGFMAFCGR